MRSTGSGKRPSRNSSRSSASKAVDLRLPTLAAVCWLVTWIVIGGRTHWWLVVGAVVLCLLVWVMRLPLVGWFAVAVALTAGVAWGVAGLRGSAVADAYLADLGEQGASVWLSGTIEGDVRAGMAAGRPYASAVIAVSQVSAVGNQQAEAQRVQVYASAETLDPFLALEAGASVTLRCRLASAEIGSGLAAEGQLLGRPEVIGPPGIVARWINGVRTGLVSAMAASPSEQAGLVPSLVVGDTSHVPVPMQQVFQETALTHLMAVSGSNLTLLLGFLMTAARWAGVRGRWIRVVVAVGVCLFVAICRAEPSVLRAAAMGGVALLALGRGRGPEKGIRHLGLAVLLLLLWDPFLSQSWGFALSVSACLGIMCWARSWADRMAGWAPPWLGEALCIPLSAQVATLPLIVGLSGSVSLVGVVANVLVGPFVGPVTLLGMGAALLGTAFPLGALALGWLAGWAIQPIIWIAQYLAGFPTASWLVGSSWVVLLMSLGGLVGAVRWLPRILGSAAATAAALVGIIALAAWQPQVWRQLADWQVAACDVGQGDATALAAGQGSVVLVDVGPADGGAADCLAQLGVKEVPLLVLTHFHADHIGALTDVLARFDVKAFLISPLESPTAAAQSVREQAMQEGATVSVATPGQRLTIGNVSWLTIGPTSTPAGSVASGEGESSVENDSSIIGLATIGTIRVLLAGDAETQGQTAALRYANDTRTSVTVDVLKLPHHGSSRFSQDLYERSGATISLVSAGRNNPYGHPSDAALSAAAGLRMTTARTDTQGIILLAKRGDEVLMNPVGKAK